MGKDISMNLLFIHLKLISTEYIIILMRLSSLPLARSG